ncbi:hypothetical protein PC9H_005249 [Pleurotus ostreatus]|uniref:Transcription initiation factor TFIID subunit 8 n=1 Tax=Pleurotus ostreatus TaxID=5322 RepID=A0A8H7DU78_PLEOS|nr:uncharacterized protein PC9H_005249 [Pleurotus ostreatus]KAF7433299.1 hypothetical protein PC9H_005249 [Pleurotus ostreatus]
MSTYQPAPGGTAQAYGAYQPGAYAVQYSPNTSPNIPGVASTYFMQQQQQFAPKPELPSPPPIIPSVTPEVASQAMAKLISYQLKESGFNKAENEALQKLEHEVVAFVQELYQRAHEYANLANRGGPIATDLLRSCQEHGLESKDLRRIRTKHRKKAADGFNPPTLISPPSRSPSPELLPSDDEQPPVPVTLRSLPAYFPSLPPKHTYLRTPASPPKKAALPSLEKKLQTAGLVQESLRNLMLATEDSSGQEDAELLGHIVNWEAGLHPRKRWKVGTH